MWNRIDWALLWIAWNEACLAWSVVMGRKLSIKYKSTIVHLAARGSRASEVTLFSTLHPAGLYLQLRGSHPRHGHLRATQTKNDGGRKPFKGRFYTQTSERWRFLCSQSMAGLWIYSLSYHSPSLGRGQRGQRRQPREQQILAGYSCTKGRQKIYWPSNPQTDLTLRLKVE